jgi:hypothetical protein
MDFGKSKIYSRRDFLRVASLGATASLLTACGAGGATAVQRPTNPPAPPTVVPPTTTPAIAAQIASGVEAAAAARIVVGDVLDYALTSEDWSGAFGFVTFRLHEALYNGEVVYHIRTDASEPTFAAENKLVYVPLLNAALTREETTMPFYTFNQAAADQLPILSAIPGQDAYSPAMRVHQVTFKGTPFLLDSADKIQAAEAAGEVTIEKLNLIVNFPLVKWPGGELTVDEAKAEYLGTGQLLAPIDTASLKVTFKLHQCFPGSRYIVTDTSAAPMAPMMSVAASPPTQALTEIRATDKIWVFGNGLKGSGVMGFQPAIFGSKATEPAWSPFWDHFTLVWQEEAPVRVLHNAAEVQAALDANEVELFNGTPDSHPNGFVVNCPVPVLAPNTFTV